MKYSIFYDEEVANMPDPLNTGIPNVPWQIKEGSIVRATYATEEGAKKGRDILELQKQSLTKTYYFTSSRGRRSIWGTVKGFSGSSALVYKKSKYADQRYRTEPLVNMLVFIKKGLIHI